ncbi:MAG: acyl-CoA dehydratase activase [Candidatus Cloacimonetes bacterium]|nr:acyl-CoA dehydratase activase [Candidatus Cloacimonadota bacterium]
MTKLCLFDLINKKFVDYLQEETKYNHEEQFDLIVEKILKHNHIEKHLLKSVVCTGYGRKNYSKATKYVSEIICHAKGVFTQNSNIKTVIDIGGQDSKIILLSKNGKVYDFLMNDKCAAGTGRFLEKVAQFFDISMNQLADIPIKTDNHIEISSTCVVFAESEIIGLLSSGEKKENIISAVYNSIIHRIISMNGAIGIDYPIAFVGGVAKIQGMVMAMNHILESDVFVPDFPEYTGAMGAAVIETGD